MLVEVEVADIPSFQGVQANLFSVLMSCSESASSSGLISGLTARALAVLYYDYCLTFSAEAETFWKAFTVSWPSALFIVNRYVSLLGPIPILMENFGNTSQAVSDLPPGRP